MPDGSILLWFPPDAAESEWCIDAECDEGPPTSVAFTRSEASEVAIRFADPAWLEVRPEGMDAAVDFEIRVSAASGGLGGTLGRNRVVRLGPLAPGPVDISVLRRGVELPCSPGDAVLTAGLNRLTVRVAVPADVVVSFDPEWQGAHVTLEGTDTEFRLWDRVQGPEVRFEAVPPGRYRLDLADDHRAGFMDLVAPAPGIVRFVPLRVDALRVAVTDPGGALARMGFSDGDLLVAVGTEPVRSLSGGWALLSLAASKEREDFTVLRRGVEKIVTVECPAFRGDLGGSISPATR
jgi:hypothetical protein